jgi:hypothetical protein
VPETSTLHHVFDEISSNNEIEAPLDQDVDSINHDLRDYIVSGMRETNLDSEKNSNEVFRARHQVYTIITGDSGEGSGDFDSLGNPLVNTGDLT